MARDLATVSGRTGWIRSVPSLTDLEIGEQPVAWAPYTAVPVSSTRPSLTNSLIDLSIFVHSEPEAIGNPADGYYANRVIKESGGWSEDVSDAEIIEAIKLLGETEGIFAETAGGVTLGVAKKLIEQGRLPRDESIVLCITGNGLKTQEAIIDAVSKPRLIGPSLREFDALAEADEAARKAA